ARDLLGEGLCHLVITNGVDVTTVCNLGRSIPSALDVALVERDRHCVVPGCDATQRLERDHWIVSFKDGGPATLENLARLCGHHHYLRTHQGFSLHGGPGRWRWEPPAHPVAPSRRRNRSRPERPAKSKTKPTTKSKTTKPTGPGDPDLFTTRE
ncbi:MAG: HNH endonuclease signature motif containing protein, partial [Acidimicrobiales bacterium]